MSSRILFTAVAVAALSFLTACGGGDAAEDNAANQARPASIGGIGGSGATSIGGIGGSGVTSIGGIGGSGATTQSIGGIGGSGVQSVGAAPACGLTSVNVTIAGAWVNADGAAPLGSAGWVAVPVAAPVRTNLLKLATGGALPLDFSTLPDGTYRQIRLLLVADAAAPLANSVVAADLRETALAVPVAAQGGLALAPTITVAQGQVAASFGGLDVCKAVSSTAGTYALDSVARDSTTQVASAY